MQFQHEHSEHESTTRETSRIEEDVDFYEALEVSPNAGPDTIHRVYRMLALRYHPDNKETGDEESFKRVLAAYRVLSDPEKRAAYDVRWRAGRKLQWQIFTPEEGVPKIAVEKRKRRSILALLYTKRVNAPRQPTMTIHELEDLLGCPRDHLEVGLWFLKQRGWVERGDNGRYSITVEGFEEAENHGIWPVPKDRLLAPSRTFRMPNTDSTPQ